MTTIKRYNQLLNEKLGVNKDVEILSEFIIDSLANAEPGKTYIFQREDTPIADFQEKLNKQKDVIFIYNLPKLETKVYKIILNYVKEDERFPGEAFFDPSNSKYTKHGFIFKFAFLYRKQRGKKIWKHYIYHEVNHAFQFTKMGKKKTMFNPKYLRNNILKEMFPIPPYNLFLNLVYTTIKIEQGSFITQLYGKVKHRKEIKNLEDLQNYFKKKTNYEYRIAHDLMKIDLNKLFNAKIKDEKGNIIPLTNRVQMRQFFTMYKQFGEKINEFENVKEFFKNIPSLKIELKNLISEQELDATLKNYTKYFNKVGFKMLRKLDKVYSLLLDYYTEEGFEKRKKEELEKPVKSKDETTKKEVSKIKNFMDSFLGKSNLVKKAKEFLDKDKITESVKIKEEKENIAYKLDDFNNIQELAVGLTDEQLEELFVELIEKLFDPYIGAKSVFTLIAKKCKDPINLDPRNFKEENFEDSKEHTINLIGYYYGYGVALDCAILVTIENNTEHFYLLDLVKSARDPDQYPIWVIIKRTFSEEDPYGEEIW
jgi:hypothetical protein